MAEQAARYGRTPAGLATPGPEWDEGIAVGRHGRDRGLALLRRNRAAQLSLAFLALVVLAALLAPWLAPHDPTRQESSASLRAGVWAGDTTYLLGTDLQGRDVLSRLIYGARVSVAVGVTAVAISVLLGVLAGLVAGYYGGPLGDALMRLADVQLAFPFLLLAVAVVAAVGAGLLNVILILGIAGWAAFARVVRSQVLSIKQREFVEAVRALGARQPAVVVRHVVPNVLTSVIVLGTATVANNIVVEASLTFLGLGVQPTIPSWGSMLADARDYLAVAWWMGIFPGMSLMLTVLAINLLGDWLRDYLDPTLRNV
jgi:peptide/nickel transport system permease protein